MIPVKQTKTGDGGNCFRACVASILELSMEDVPDFCNENPDNWFVSFCDWLRQFGMTAMMIKAERWKGSYSKILRDVDLLAGGKSAIRDNMHEVIYRNGEMIHDPAPEELGLANGPRDYIIFVNIKPQDAVKASYVNKNIKVGIEEGEVCNRNGCEGIMYIPPVRGCICHLGHPPCQACVDNNIICSKCGHELVDR